MPDNKKNEPEFTVTDRRRFSVEDDEVRPAERPPETGKKEAEEQQAVPRPAPAAEAAPEAHPERAMPPRPTEQERAEGSRAYKQSTDMFDAQLRHELGGQMSGEEFKANFDRIVEPLYVTALVQLGFMGQENQGQRRVDIIGARESIDALSLLQEKTKGNLSAAESGMLEDVLYDIRMKYLEITNALARAVQNPPAGAPPDLKR